MEQQNLIAQARDIVTQAPIADLATVDENGFPHLRPMLTLGTDDDFTVYFSTARDMRKCLQINANHNVAVSWSANEDDMVNWKHVLIKGKAEVSDEKSIRHRMWSEMLAPYFPGGADDPNYVLIVVKPTELFLTEGENYPAKSVEF